MNPQKSDSFRNGKGVHAFLKTYRLTVSSIHHLLVALYSHKNRNYIDRIPDKINYHRYAWRLADSTLAFFDNIEAVLGYQQQAEEGNDGGLRRSLQTSSTTPNNETNVRC